MTKSLLDSNGIIGQEALSKLEEVAPDVSCECPAHLIQIYKSVKAFTEYQKNCIDERPQDVLTHEWLKSTSQNLEHLLSNAIVTLARLEGMVTDDNEIVKK